MMAAGRWVVLWNAQTRLVKAEQMYLTINETLESKVLRDLNVLNIASTATEAALEKIHSTNLQQEHKMSELGRCMKKTEIELKDKAPVAVTDQVHNLVRGDAPVPVGSRSHSNETQTKTPGSLSLVFPKFVGEIFLFKQKRRKQKGEQSKHDIP